MCVHTVLYAVRRTLKEMGGAVKGELRSSEGPLYRKLEPAEPLLSKHTSSLPVWPSKVVEVHPVVELM